MNKTALTIGGIVILLIAVAGGSFYGGMLFERQQTTSVRSAFFANRGGAGGDAGGYFPGGDAGGGFPGGGNFAGGAGGGFPGGGNFAGGAGGGGRGAVGTIKSIDGNVITLSTPQAEVKITLSDTTVIQKMVPGAQTDLKVGDRITARGTRDAAGNVTEVTDIQITAIATGQ